MALGSGFLPILGWVWFPCRHSGFMFSAVRGTRNIIYRLWGFPFSVCSSSNLCSSSPVVLICISSVFFIKLVLFSPGVDNSCRCGRFLEACCFSASQVRQLYLLWLPRCSVLLWGKFLYCFLAFGKKRQPVVWCFLRVFLTLGSPLVCDRARDAP